MSDIRLAFKRELAIGVRDLKENRREIWEAPANAGERGGFATLTGDGSSI
jgi:hypothetical protein